jgi:hypothetical protein
MPRYDSGTLRPKRNSISVSVLAATCNNDNHLRQNLCPQSYDCTSPPVASENLDLKQNWPTNVPTEQLGGLVMALKLERWMWGGPGIKPRGLRF